MCFPLHAKYNFVFVSRRSWDFLYVNKASCGLDWSAPGKFTHSQSLSSISLSLSRTRTHARPQAHTVHTHTHSALQKSFQATDKPMLWGRNLKHVADFQNKLRCGVGKSIKVWHAVTISCSHTRRHHRNFVFNYYTRYLFCGFIIYEIFVVWFYYLFFNAFTSIASEQSDQDKKGIWSPYSPPDWKFLWNGIGAMADIRKRDADTSWIAITAAAEVFAEYVI